MSVRRRKEGEMKGEVLGIEVIGDEDELVQDYWDEGKQFVFSQFIPSSSSPFPYPPSSEDSKFYSISLFEEGTIPLEQVKYIALTADKKTKVFFFFFAHLHSDYHYDCFFFLFRHSDCFLENE